MIDKILLSPMEASRLCGVSSQKIRTWCELEDFPAFRDNRDVKIPLNAFIDWLDNRGKKRFGMPEKIRVRVGK